jgi:hypothetical protein
MTILSYATQNVLRAAAADAAFAAKQAALGLLSAAGDYASALPAVKARFVRSPQAAAGPAPQARVESLALGIEGQWRRATGIIRAAIASFRNIETFQVAAARQIDAADYALQLLMQDLGAAMPIPADGRELRAVLAEAARATTPMRQKKALAA